jgi:hypothetical protein
MTLLRRLANGLSRSIVRRARPGAKEWAEATAREMEWIEEDWSAVRWSLGSLRILTHGCRFPITSLAQVPRAASELARNIRKRTVTGCASCAFMAPYFFWFAWHPMFRRHSPHPLMGQLGAYLTIAGAIYMTAQLLLRQGRLALVGNAAVTASEYRRELERQRDFHRGLWFWSRLLAMVPGYLLFCAGIPAGNAVRATLKAAIIVAFLTLCVVAVPVNIRLARRYQHSIDELDFLENVR